MSYTFQSGWDICPMENLQCLPCERGALPPAQLSGNFLLFLDSRSKTCDFSALDEMRRRLTGCFHLLHGRNHHPHHGHGQHHKSHKHLSVKKELRDANDGERQILRDPSCKRYIPFCLCSNLWQKVSVISIIGMHITVWVCVVCVQDWLPSRHSCQNPYLCAVKRSKTHQSLKERFLIGRNRTN